MFPRLRASSGSLVASAGLLLSGALAGPLPVQAQSSSIAGSYNVTGTELDGSSYSGTVSVTPDGSFYDATWMLGGNTQVGVGLQQGPYAGFGWGSSNCVVADYAVQNDGTLQGQWVEVGSTALGTETDVPTSPGSNSYSVSGTNPDGSPYQGSLQVTQQGPVLQFSWQTGSNNFEGIGVAGSAGVNTGSNVAVGYGANGQGTGCGAALYGINSDGSLNGVWGVYGTSSLGAETWTPQTS